MARTTFLLLAVVAVQIECFARITKLSLSDREVLESGSSAFHEIHSATNLPPGVAVLCEDQHGRLAEPGQKWEESDFITNPNLPRKRLIWAATNSEYFVVHYERGGYAHTFHVLVARVRQGHAKPEIIWRATSPSLKDFQAFLGALKSKDELDDSSDYH